MATIRSWLTALRRRAVKLRGRTLAELRERAGQALSAALEALGLSALAREPSDATFRKLLDPAVVGRAGTRAALHEHFVARGRPAFFAGVRDGTSAALLRSDPWRDALEALRGAADLVRAGRFDLLGHPGLDFGSPIDWHLDPTTGRRAPDRHWSRIPYLDAASIGDHKVIWELNRHQHLVVLGRAYQATGDERYAIAFAEQLTSWMEANPPKRGVNWASSLEVAFRAISWLWALELFRRSPALTPALLERMLTLLYLHGRHLERYLSTYFSPNTHLTGEALGLFYLGTLLPELRRSARWRARGWAILERELPRQVHEDGVYFEQASYYHRYTVDFYLHAVILARRNGLPVPPAMLDRLELAVDHLADLTRVDGTIPMIGDDDGGRLVALEERMPADVRAALGVASVVLERPDLSRVAGRVTQEVLWLLGPDGAGRVGAALTAAPPTHASRLYPVGGYAVMRDGWDSGSHHAVIDAGPLGAMHGGHAHSDALSFELAVAGCPVVVDPGTFTYTGSPTERDRFRHSAMHNTVSIDGQTASVPAGPFAWASRADARVEHWWTGQLVDSFLGSHDGFQRLPEPATHRRRVLFVRSAYWVIVDTVETRGVHEAAAHLHLTPGATVAAVGDLEARITVPCAGGDATVVLRALGNVDGLLWSDEWVSPVYGVRTLAPAARLVSRGAGRRDLVTVLIPLTAGPSPVVRELPCSGGRAVVVDRPGVYDVIVLRERGTAQVGAIQIDADVAVVRRGSAAGPIEAVALLGSAGRLEADGLSFEAGGSAEMHRTASGWSVIGDGHIVERSRQ
ncbi:MAG: alginate lyase family protein [Gemmatimonadaceae bacterium]|nr:alginate lyase family protein [Gemmatimonadaceae bacterium]NUR33092.1 alginate lyase family protein [Gemmatimonadaceae bacterium]